MTEYVFRAWRQVSGKRSRSRLWYGRYSLGRGQPVKTVALHTPDKSVAKKRLRDIIVEAQREQEGLSEPRSLRAARAAALIELIAEYANDLRSQKREEKHVHDTTARLVRIVGESGWGRLGDITPESFVRWRADFKGSAKTLKEYQISANAFLNWMVRIDRLEKNPLAKVGRVETRGKQVRPYRAFTVEELCALFSAVNSERRIAYLTLLYTGQRMSEIASLVVEDVDFADPPFVRIRAETTKDKDKRAVPLHPMLAAELRRFIPVNAPPDALVFPDFPSYDALRADFKRAGIERLDTMGRSVHFHSFRKTWQTMGVRAGISQRVAQDILGHSDPALTANVYTDFPAVGTAGEIAKLPWLFNERAQLRALNEPKNGVILRFQEIVGELAKLAKAIGAEGLSTDSGKNKWLPGLGSNQRPSD